MIAEPASATSRSSTATAIATRLGAIVDVDAGDEAGAACAIGGVAPALVARPANAPELAAAVAAVATAGGALVALGRGAHRSLGHPPERYDVALLTERLRCVIDYTPADMTVTVEAGTTIADLEALLARERQWLPIEPPLPASTTIGGLVAADLNGPLAASQGRLRDFVIGIGLVTAAGVQARAGGRVVKNVAGFDLMKLVVGSLGTLAIVTDLTLKVRPLPERQHGLVLDVRGVDEALAVGAAIEGALAVVAHGSLVPDACGARVVVRLGGVAADVAAARHRVHDLAARHAATIRLDEDAADPDVAACFAMLRDRSAQAPADLVVRLATLPSRVPALATDALAAAESAVSAWHADPRRGVLTLAFAPASAESLAKTLAALAHIADAHGAHRVVERCPLALAASVAVWHPLPPALPLMRRMKAVLDPGGVLSPGRFIGRI